MNWYILQVYSGYEKRVLESIKELVEKKGLESRINELFIPTQEVLQMRYGKKNSVKKNLIRGYVFLNMSLDEQLFHLIKSIGGVSKFLGSLDKDGIPFPVSQAEIDKMLNQVDSQNSMATSSQHHFEVGEEVKIIAEPFASFKGIIQEIEEEKMKLKISVSIFGRQTPVELEYNQVEKIKD
ncbi:MAG: transcription termination/antitermination protein NusG [Alphaproteobacteria bacterium]|jgi:transcriptional antiterminator NusG|nr:transcription termination/antitermination protein NusG [Alphaproteobacteria bacterium]